MRKKSLKNQGFFSCIAQIQRPNEPLITVIFSGKQKPFFNRKDYLKTVQIIRQSLLNYHPMNKFDKFIDK